MLTHTEEQNRERGVNPHSGQNSYLKGCLTTMRYLDEFLKLTCATDLIDMKYVVLLGALHFFSLVCLLPHVVYSVLRCQGVFLPAPLCATQEVMMSFVALPYARCSAYVRMPR